MYNIKCIVTSHLTLRWSSWISSITTSAPTVRFILPPTYTYVSEWRHLYRYPTKMSQSFIVSAMPAVFLTKERARNSTNNHSSNTCDITITPNVETDD